MAEGKPLLATWSDNTLRLFELADEGFVQIASGSHVQTSTATTPLSIYFAYDSAMLFVRCLTSTTIQNFTSFRLDLSTITSASLFSPTGARGAYSDYSDATKTFVALSLESSSGYLANISEVLRSEAPIARSNTIANSAVANALRALSISPDGQIVVRGYVGSATPTVYFTGRNGFDFATPGVSIGGTKPIDIICWSADSRFVLLASSIDNAIQVWKRNGNELFKVFEFSDPLGNPAAIAFSPNLRILAVSYQSTDGRRTAIYRRSGNVFQKIQTLDGIFGSLLSFTADGKYLIDATNRRAFRSTAQGFVEAVGLMTNVNAGTVVQAVSTHVQTPKGVGFFYDGAVPSLTFDSVDLNDLKLALLSDAAAFNATDSTVNQVTQNGTAEAKGFGWPVGGKPLTNPQKQPQGSSAVNITFDEIKQIIADGNLNFRYGVVYEVGADRPLIFIDFQKAQIAEQDSELTFTFNGNGLIAYSA